MAIGAVELMMVGLLWLFPVAGIIILLALLVTVWRMMKAQEATANALADIRDSLRRT